jgi:hypothetical protein
VFVAACWSPRSARPSRCGCCRRYPRARGERFDLLGAALLFGALLALSLALTMGQARGFDDAWILGLFAASFASGDRSSSRSSAGGVADRRPAALPRSRADIGLLSGADDLRLDLRRDLPHAVLPGRRARVPPEPHRPADGGGAAGAGRHGAHRRRLADRFGPRPITVVGMALLVGRYLAVGTLDEHTTPLGYVLRFLPVGLGMGTFQTPNNTAIMGAARRGASGVTGGLLPLTRSLGRWSAPWSSGAWAARAVARRAPRGSDATLLPGRPGGRAPRRDRRRPGHDRSSAWRWCRRPDPPAAATVTARGDRPTYQRCIARSVR